MTPTPDTEAPEGGKAQNVISANFSKLTPPGAHPALMAASDYGMACVLMAQRRYGTQEYDEALRRGDEAWQRIAAALGVAIPGDGRR